MNLWWKIFMQMIKHLKRIVEVRTVLYVTGTKPSKCVRTPLSLVVYEGRIIPNFPILRDIFISKNEDSLLDPNHVNFIVLMKIVKTSLNKSRCFFRWTFYRKTIWNLVSNYQVNYFNGGRWERWIHSKTFRYALNSLN